MADVVFNMQNLALGYHHDKPVLHIDKLNIKRGELTFITGPSGAGKSTLLEGLGLMKNTLLSQPGEATCSFNSNAGKTVDFTNIWSGKAQDITHLRHAHFSFIFQYTNLMPNFTLGENICFAAMLQGKSMSEVKKDVLDLMAKLNLDAELFDKPATLASGGQRQRAAFVRALCKPFEVLFCDEPTGNLDKENAISLFEILKANIKSQNRAAVIVSHDDHLSEIFADRRVVIDYRGDLNQGRILE